MCLWGRGPKFSGLPVADISEIVGFDRYHVTSMGRLCDALPPAPSQLLSSQLAAHALRIRSGIPIVTEAEARKDPPLGAWLLRLLGLAPWLDVPLPIVRCVLVCCPRIFPGSVLMSVDGSLPVVSLPRFGASLVTQVASAFAACYSALSGDPAHYRFVCDGLGAPEGATIVFYSTFIPDLRSHLIEPLRAPPLAAGTAASDGRRGDSRWRDECGRVCTSRVIFAVFGGVQVWCARRSDTRTLDAVSVVQTAADGDALAACFRGFLDLCVLPSALLRRFLSLCGPPHQEELLSPKGTRHLVSTWAVHASRLDLERVRLTPRGQRALYGPSVRAASQFLSSAVAASGAREAIESLMTSAVGSDAASLSLTLQCVHGFVCFEGCYDDTLRAALY